MTNKQRQSRIACRQAEIRLLREELPANSPVLIDGVNKRINAIARLQGYGPTVAGYSPDLWMLNN